MEIISKEDAKASGLRFYFTGKKCKYGHISKRLVSTKNCHQCVIERSRTPEERERHKLKSLKRYWEDPERFREEAKQRRQDPAEKERIRLYYQRPEVKQRIKEYFSDPDIAEYIKMYHKNYKQIPENKARRQKWLEEYYKNPEVRERIAERRNRPDVKAKKIKSDRRYYQNNKDKFREYAMRPEVVCARFARETLNRLNTNWKGSRKDCEKMLGYTHVQFKAHIESQFKDGMSWENRSEWHVDHIKPISLFISEGVVDVSIINALSNLQPLWAHENLSKGAKY
ncbi:hypothetical protein NVP1030O_01 [Vibrio phage 1.030.O._10N.222.55.F9]|nr:hypothetical protein NVP1030O_01 [Vibrio phage 1.030.O._10N.222.55.F9]